MRVATLAEDLKTELLQLLNKMNTQDRMKVAINLNITAATVTRYLEGDVKMNNLELAEQICDECNKILSDK